MVPFWLVCWWFWRACCISQDAYLLHVYLLCIYKLPLPTCPWHDINKSLVKDTTYVCITTCSYGMSHINLPMFHILIDSSLVSLIRSQDLHHSWKRVKFFPCGCKNRRSGLTPIQKRKTWYKVSSQNLIKLRQHSC